MSGIPANEKTEESNVGNGLDRSERITLPQRKRQRLDGYDYSKSNYYFVTICTNKKENCLEK